MWSFVTPANLLDFQRRTAWESLGERVLRLHLEGYGWTRTGCWTRCLSADASGSNRSREPFEKPVPLLAELVERHAPPGGLVLDPFAGSGSTLVAARQTGRAVVGIELDERLCEIAAKRCAQDVLDLAVA
jgi:DNA modification methylase